LKKIFGSLAYDKLLDVLKLTTLEKPRMTEGLTEVHKLLIV